MRALVAVLSLFLVSACAPDPWYTGGRIDQVRADMHARFAPGSCLSGTFISSSIIALEIPDVRIRPDAEFWIHNASPTSDEPSPLVISRAGTRAMFRGLRPDLRAYLLAIVGDNSVYHVIKGSDLSRWHASC